MKVDYYKKLKIFQINENNKQYNFKTINKK